MDFRDLLNGLLAKAARWNPIGIQLGLSPDELDAIRANSIDVEECLTKALGKWHKKTLNPTWKEVIVALRTPALGEMKLAKELEEKFPIPSCKESSEPAKDKVSVGVVKKNMSKIRGSFANLVRKVAEKLEDKDINMRGFRMYIVNLFPPGDVIANTVNVTDILEAISRHCLWDFSNYSPIEQIASSFGGDDPELSAWVSDYKSELAGFKATTRIVDYIKACEEEEEIAEPDQSLRDNMACYDKRYCRKLTIKLKERVTQASLVYIDQLWQSIADHFLLPSLSVLLHSIHEGCIEVTWMVPTLLAFQIQENVQDSKEFLKSSKVMRMILDNEILYDEEGMDMKLLKACDRGDLDEAVALLTYGVDVDTADRKGWTPLLVAIREGNLKLVELLLDYSADVNFASDGLTALSAACHYGHLEIVAILLQYNTSPNSHSKVHWSPLMHAIDHKDERLPLVQLLLDAGAVIDFATVQNGWCPLSLACNNGHLNIAELLIQRGADVNFWEEDKRSRILTPLVAAADCGHYQICHLLLEHGAAVDLPEKADGRTPLFKACEHGAMEVITLLLERGANVHARSKAGMTVMHGACAGDHLDVIKVLRSYGATLDVTSQNGSNPLMSASWEGHVAVVQYLLDQSPALINIQNKIGWSPVMSASRNGHSAVVTELLSRGANADLYTHKSELSALIVATNEGYLDTVNLLLQENALVNHTEKSTGWSALFFAAKAGNLPLVKLLLEYKADFTLKSKDSDVTAYDIASIEGWSDVCIELEMQGYKSLAPPTEDMRREVERSDLLHQSFLDMDNIRTFHEVLRHGGRDVDTSKFHSDNPSSPHHGNQILCS